MAKIQRFSIFFGLLAFVLGLDQWSKHYAVAHIKGKPTAFYFFDLIQIVYAENKGAWGSLGGEWPPLLRQSFLLYLPAIILLGLAIFLLFKNNVKQTDFLPLTCIFTGGMGNLIDRFRFNYVVDFLYIGYGPIGTNIFNVADVVIMIGFSLLLIYGFLEWKNSRLSKDSTPPAAEN